METLLALCFLVFPIHGALIYPPTSKLVKLGTNRHTFMCKFTTSAKESKWLKNGNPVKDNRDKYLITGYTDGYSMLEIKNVSFSDSGEYTCTNLEDRASGNLLVAANPTCSLSHDDFVNMTFKCEVKFGGSWIPRMTLKGDGRVIFRKQLLSSDSDGNHATKLVTHPGHKYSSRYVCYLEAMTEDISHAGKVQTEDKRDESSGIAYEEISPEVLASVKSEEWSCSKTATKPMSVLMVQPKGYWYGHYKRINKSTVFVEGNRIKCDTENTPQSSSYTKYEVTLKGTKLSRPSNSLVVKPWMSGSYVICNATNPLGSTLVSTENPITVYSEDEWDNLYRPERKEKRITTTTERNAYQKGYESGYLKLPAIYRCYNDLGTAREKTQMLINVSASLGALLFAAIVIIVVMTTIMCKPGCLQRNKEKMKRNLETLQNKMVHSSAYRWMADKLGQLSQKMLQKAEDVDGEEQLQEAEPEMKKTPLDDKATLLTEKEEMEKSGTLLI